METATPKVIKIPAKPEFVRQNGVQRQLRVAAYCRVSTDDEEQLTSYEAQQEYYTDKIMTNKEWTLAGIFADEGITGTSARKRPEFLRMIRMCKQKKIDFILVKSISRFARNTVDCLNYIRILKELGIAVYFEKENINTLSAESEMLITIMGAFAQAESESISANVKWGKRKAMADGKATIQYKRLYAYEKGEDGNPKIIPEQAEIVQELYKRFLAGDSLRMLQAWLEQTLVPNVSGNQGWTIRAVRTILTNEKYCGDVLLQKTFIQDCISKKVIKNTGQLPQTLVRNHHEGIVDRATYDAVQAEFARRNAGKSPSKKNASTGLSSYASKYALSERLVCGECGTLYRRCTWNIRGKKKIVWRCVSRLDYGKKYCHTSPTLEEGILQKNILVALNSLMSDKDRLIQNIAEAMEVEQASIPKESISLGDVQRRLEELDNQTKRLVSMAAAEGDIKQYEPKLKAILDEVSTLKEKRICISKQLQNNTQVMWRIKNMMEVLEQAPEQMVWNESIIRQLVDTVKVISKDKLEIHLHGGMIIEQTMGE